VTHVASLGRSSFHGTNRQYFSLAKLTERRVLEAQSIDDAPGALQLAYRRDGAFEEFAPGAGAAKPTLASNPRHSGPAPMYETNGGLVMAARETSAQREKKELDRQLDEELHGTFPASDPLKITRFSAKPRSTADRRQKDATVRKNDS
jgi:hypothetical protein